MTDKMNCLITQWGKVYGDKDTLGAIAAVLREPATPAPQPRPFDLEAAKRGEPLVTRNGRKARFVAHIPEAGEGYRVAAFLEGGTAPVCYAENGRYYTGFKNDADLFMAPKPKRTVFVNVYEGTSHGTEEAARNKASAHALAVAVPVEVEA